MKKIAILQSNYIPWKGYFDIIAKVDLFIFHDDLQYTKGDWRNRNKIKTANGCEWLTIPCGSSEKRLICDIQLNDSSWQKEHWNKIVTNYQKAPFFNKYKSLLEYYYLDNKWDKLSDLNQSFIKTISSEIFGFKTVFEDSRKYELKFTKAERVIELLKKAGADSYLSGPSAKNYISEKEFINNGISIEWMDYSGYKEYNQLHGNFIHEVTILDLLLNEGDEAIKLLKCHAYF
jgi:hypothetical protein